MIASEVKRKTKRAHTQLIMTAIVVRTFTNMGLLAWKLISYEQVSRERVLSSPNLPGDMICWKWSDYLGLLYTSIRSCSQTWKWGTCSLPTVSQRFVDRNCRYNAQTLPARVIPANSITSPPVILSRLAHSWLLATKTIDPELGFE